MNKPALKYVLITILGIGAIGAVGAQTYYTHELAQRVADRADYTQPTASPGQWDPWSDLQRLQARIDQAFDQSFDALPVAAQGGATRVTLEQQADDYVVKATIPGARESDIKVNLDGRLLSISSQTRGSEKQTAQNGAVTSEATYSGAFEEAFTLPGPVIASDMKSDFKDGVLTLTIPKAGS
jgi:HSP20 family protein